jgi:hypothetical protein
MPSAFLPRSGKKKISTRPELWQLVDQFSPEIQALKARGHRPLQMTFEPQWKALTYFHLQEHDSGRHLLKDPEIYRPAAGH